MSQPHSHLRYLKYTAEGPERREAALELFKQGVGREAAGQMADAVDFYRKAFKLDPVVDKAYREELKQTGDEAEVPEFARLSLLDEESEEGYTGTPLTGLPDDILLIVLQTLVAQGDMALWIAAGQTCHHMATLAFESSDCWHTMCRATYRQQQYRIVDGLVASFELLSQQWEGRWLAMLKGQPFLKFGGVYILVVNMYREGGRLEGTMLWNNPIRIITYYRYLRFFPNGRALRVLTTDEPRSVVQRLAIGWDETDGVPDVYSVAWSMTPDGIVTVTGDGPLSNHTFVNVLQLKSTPHAPHHKLVWVDNHLVHKEDGMVVPFLLEDDKPFAFSRVRSYANGKTVD